MQAALAHGRDRNAVLQCAFLLSLCGALTWLRWDSLFGLGADVGHWLLAGYRTSQGQLMYRDFSWQYCPLFPPLLGAAFRLFGPGFRVANVVIAAISTVLVLLAWLVARRLVPRPVAFACAVALAAITGTASNLLVLFSLNVYSPALLTGLVGALLFLLGAFGYLQTGRMSRAAWLQCSTGCTLALLSKQEFCLAVPACLLAVALADLRIWFAGQPASAWLRHYALLAAATAGPAAVVYTFVGAVAGFRNLFLGLTNYGLGTLSCPWWPTGIGLFAALGFAGFAIGLAALLSLARFKDFRLHYGRQYGLWCALGVAGMFLFACYLPFALDALYGLPVAFTISKERLVFAGRYIASPGRLLLPVIWISAAILLALSARLIRALISGEQLSPAFGQKLLLVTASVALAVRALFGSYWDEFPTTAPSAFPVLLIAGPYLLLCALSLPTEIKGGAAGSVPRRACLATLLVLVIFGLAGTAANARSLHISPYNRLETAAGPIRIPDQRLADLYRYVASRSGKNDIVLDVDGHTGFAFAALRPDPLFLQFFLWNPPADVLLADFKRIQNQPPALVIGRRGPHFGVVYGVRAMTGCTCPKIVWWPNKPAWDEHRTPAPVLRYLEENYRVDTLIGDFEIRTPKTSVKVQPSQHGPVSAEPAPVRLSKPR